MIKRIFLFSIFFQLGICASSLAQFALTGIVLDAESRDSLPYVNIGIRHKNIGTCSLPDGRFKIQIPQQNENDTLTFSMVGYSELKIPVKTIRLSRQETFLLHPKTVQLNAFIFSERKLTEKKFGIKKESPGVHLTDGSTNQNDIFEIAQLIRIGNTSSRICSVNLLIEEARKDSGTFRINFYKYDGMRPTERILEKSIVQVCAIQAGWLRFDLMPYSIYLQGDFIVAIEFIPAEKKTEPIYYEVKLGGSSKSFVRTSSQGEWTTPPHHYRLYVSALVQEDQKKSTETDQEENETVPDTSLFSQFVKDSFSIFIHLPKDYIKKKNQHFPVIYLLDANAYFDLVTNAMIEHKTEAILIGIGYSGFMQMDSLRKRDYTFPKGLAADSLPVSGGADKFLLFIEQELIPFIDQKYRTDTSNRTLMGHSLGGYFTLFVLSENLKNKKAVTFTNYIAASPSLYYYDEFLLHKFEKLTPSDSTKQYTVFLTFGEREDAEDGETEYSGLKQFRSFVFILQEKRFKNIQVKNKIYPKFGHIETVVPTFTEGLNAIK